MSHSALVLLARLPLDADGDPVGEYFAVGSREDGKLILHFAPGATLPTDAMPIYDGHAPWSWGQFAREYPALFARVVAHEYAGESTAFDLPTD